MLVFRVALLLSCIGAGGADLKPGNPGVCPTTIYYSEVDRIDQTGIYVSIRARTVAKCCNGFTHIAVGDSCLATCPQGCYNGNCTAPYFCQCMDGFFGPDCHEDINECGNESLSCPRGAQCINTYGSYRCECSGGFSTQGQACIEVDECAEGTDDCSHGCVNTEGSFRCTCPDGYFLGIDRNNCRDEDECLVNNGGCIQTCNNSEGSYSCGCFEGYELQANGTMCKATDLCSTGLQICSHNCSSVEGGYFCTCPSGCVLSADKANCQDVDECVDRFTGCEQLCVNIGNCSGYQCDCRAGYSLNRDQKTCIDVNECLVDNGNCDDFCANTIGSFYCNCTQPGFILGSDGRSCEEVLCPELTALDSGDMTCSSPRMTVSTQCHFSCNNGFELEGSSTPTRTCQTSGVWSGTEAVCEPLTCPNVIIDQLGMVQPCHQEYQETCTFTCSRGYYFDAAGNSTLQMSCDLDGSMTDVQWSDSPICTKLEACSGPSNPCLRGSSCTSMGLTDYECDCTGTGYVGKNCQIGVITIPSIPALNISQAFVFTIQARPYNDLKIRPVADASIEFAPLDALLSSQTQSIQIAMTPKAAGVYPVSFLLSSTDRNVFRVPGNQVVIVSDPAMKPPDDYFQSRGSPKGQLQPGCCDSPFSFCSSNVVLTSTCAWDAASRTTPGVVFAKNGAFSIPVSVATAIVKPMSNLLQFGIDQSPPSCQNCPRCAAIQPYNLAPGDVLNFYRTEALAFTFIERVAPLLPAWLFFSVIQSSRSYTDTSHVTSQFAHLNVPNCERFPDLDSGNTHHFNVLMYHGLADIKVDTATTNVQGSTRPLCIAMDMCLGRQSPVFVSLPSPIKLDMNFVSRGWDIIIFGFGVSKGTPLNSTFDILLRGSLDLTNVVSIDGMGLDYSIQGQGGSTLSDIDRVFSAGLDASCTGMVMGIVQFDLKTDGGSVLYSLHSDEECATFSIGGANQGMLCGQPAISGILNDNQFTRGSSVITAFLEIPPNLRHGDRYQFDCSLAYTIYTDASATVNGMVLNTSCHELRMDRLLVQDMVQTVYFGQQKQPACLPMDVDSSIDAYPVIGIARGTGTAKLGHLMSQDQPLIQYGLNPQTGGYSAVMYDVTVMIYPTDFTVDVRIDSKRPKRLYFTKVATAGGYPFRTSVTADTDNEWDSISLDVVGVADSGSGSLIQALQSSTMHNLQTTADNAVQRVKAAEMVEANSNTTSNRLGDAKNAANKTVSTLVHELAQIDAKYGAASETIELLEEELKTVSVDILSLRDKLDDFCFITECNHSCIPDYAESICNISKTEEVPGRCNKTVIHKELVRNKVGFRQVRCENWADVERAAQNCDCGATFGNCDCQVDRAWGILCVVGGHFCRFDIFQTVEISTERTVQVDCVVALRAVVTPTPCKVWSDCARTIIDVHCERANNACYANRTNYANSLDTTEVEAADIIAGIQRNQRMIISLRLCNRSKRSQLASTHQRLEKLIIDCDSFARGSQVVDIDAIRRNNQAGLDLAYLLNSDGFTVTNISYSTTVTKEAIITVPLLVTFTVGSASTEHILSVPFDFDNPALSLTRASRQLSNAIININSASRYKRQADSEDSEFPDLEKEDLPLMNTQLMNMLSFYKMLLAGLQNIYYISETLTAKSDDLLNFYDYDPSMPSQVKKDDSPELAELLELQASLAQDAVESTAGDIQKLFPLWQASMNVFLNESGGLLDEECSGLSDCFSATIEVFRTILSSAPESISALLTTTLNIAAGKLLVVGVNQTIQIPYAIDSVQSMVTVLVDALATEYWSTLPPEIYETSPYNITAVAHDELALMCLANVSTRYAVKYQWRKDGFFLPMKNEEQLVIYSASLSDTGNYTCCVSNHAGTAESAWSYVTVLYKPIFYQEPENATAIVGDATPVILLCNCTSVPNPQFRWYYKSKFGTTFEQLEGRFGNEFQIDGPQMKDEGWYRCEAWVRYDDVIDVSTFSRPAFVSVVEYSVAVLCVPIRVELRSSTMIDEKDLKNHVEMLLDNEVLMSPLLTRPTYLELTVDLQDEEVTFVSLQVNARDAGTVSENRDVVTIARDISACRNELFKVVKSARNVLSNLTAYPKSIQVKDASDVSDYSFSFKCPTGQLTGDNFIICKNCAPGMYQTNATKTMEDGSGVEFTVEVQTCEPCPPGTYQPNQGSTECTPCSSGVSLVHGDITGEHCISHFGFEIGALNLSKNSVHPEICVWKKSKRQDDLTVDVHSCSTELQNASIYDVIEDFSSFLTFTPGDSKLCVPLDSILKGYETCDRERKLPLCLTPRSANSVVQGQFEQATVTLADDDCVCPSGYELSSELHCNDINECEDSSHTCSHGCKNTDGSYNCTCPPGYILMDSGDTCQDVDECSLENGGCSGGCNNTEGSYHCTCISGFELGPDKKTCQDVVECSLENGGCSGGCTNTEGSYHCTCISGFELGPDKKTCRDIDECSLENGGCSGGCTNTEGSYHCTCTGGFELGPDKKTCQDIDECSLENGGCSGGCNNTEGSYHCTCTSGFELGPDNRTCQDIDECSLDNGGCSGGCNNTESSYHCTCTGGFELGPDYRTCQDIDECSSDNGGCSGGCTNTEGSHHCTCTSGFELGPDKKTCQDIDECSLENGGCSGGCNNTEGSYHCTCTSGFELGPGKKTCQDIDECSLDNGGCSGGCTNTEGSYHCTCINGFELAPDKKTCQDIDECSLDNGGCSGGCNNTEGSYHCTCTSGFELGPDNRTCQLGPADFHCRHHYHLSFFNNWMGSRIPERRTIVVFSEGKGSVTLTSRIRNVNITNTIIPDVPVLINVPGTTFYFETYILTVQSEAPVELFAGHFRGNPSISAYKLFPADGGIQSTGGTYRYFGLSVPGFSSILSVKGAITISAVADDTRVSIRLSADATVQQPYRKGQTAVLRVNRRFPITITSDLGDLTGTEITSNKPLAVYSGHECGTLPTGQRFCDQLAEQIPPVSALGKKYIVAPFAGRTGGAFVKVVATHDQTMLGVLCIGEQKSVLLNSGEIHQFTTPSSMGCFVTASQPVLVGVFSAGEEYAGTGDPAMAVVPPIALYSSSAVVYSFPGIGLSKHYISIVTLANAVAGITLDGTPLESTNLLPVPLVPSQPRYVVARVLVPTGIHKVTSTLGKVGVLADGFASGNGYAYSSYMQSLPCKLKTVTASQRSAA